MLRNQFLKPFKNIINHTRTVMKKEINKREEKLSLTNFNDWNDKERFNYNLSTDLKLRCTEFDQNGNVKINAGEFSKLDLCNKYFNINNLKSRDLRKIDSKFVNQMPAILVRKQAILINLSHIRALIKADTVVLFDSFGSMDSVNQSVFIYDLQGRLKQSQSIKQSLPFEFRALEAILISVVNNLEQEKEIIANLVGNLLLLLEEEIDRDKLKQLLHYSKRLSKFEQKVLNIRDAINEVLEQDEDLAAMYLTDKLQNNLRNVDQHDEIELLLETYLKHVEEVANTMTALSSNVKTTEDIVNIILDSQRNSLLLLELKITMGTLAISQGAFIASIFGMNLKNHIELHSGMFVIITTLAFSSIIAILSICLRHMKKLIKKNH